ncbi:general transcription factor IIF subunit 2-like [Vespa mandarinia]|nr:general transcription factor IIF subunit 2-like [Vespa mandarinia]XP_035722870.1 general transcription factor IIF subunit 2-like [Vespa mandarinia]XP_046816934.1 general transcription factor IIF subunit 2 [Vespa crabro]XP_047352439.1 general transcription factor IIF subunit 2 isoform X2 [Vespa velutina]XP_047352440.1 general transcription factor IIF subunit 2 isoform X2 [Vespa velutina]
MSANSPHTEKELDLSNAGRGVWLVKVPKYIANKWEKAPGNIEVGKLKITKNPGQKAEVSLRLSEAVLALKEPGEEDIPKQHRLDVTTVTRQMLGVFSHVTPSVTSDSIVPESEKLYMEGRIVQKLECRPYADNCYMKLKLESIKKASVPQRQVQQLDRVVHNFKPVSDHKHNIQYAEKKKAEGKKMRDNKDAVLDMLFAAFEKHQYYNIRDLVKITRQPIVYLKEILNEVCNYNLKNPHRNMWELKPEYRHYKEEEEKSAENDSKKTNESDDD